MLGTFCLATWYHRKCAMEAGRTWRDREPGRALPDPWLCALDEAATICSLPSLTSLLPEAAAAASSP